MGEKFEKSTQEQLVFKLAITGKLLKAIRENGIEKGEKAKAPDGKKFFGKPIPAGRVLHSLEEKGAISQLDLADAFKVSPAASIEIVDKLVADGFASTEGGADDVRLRTVSITEAGIEHHHQGHVDRAQKAADLVSGLSGDQQEQLLELVKVLNESLKDKATALGIELPGPGKKKN